MEVLSVKMPVLLATESWLHKLNALDEHSCDFGLRDAGRPRASRAGGLGTGPPGTAGNDFAAALIFLLERLGIVPPAA